MSGHRKWGNLRREKITSPEMLSYVQGYILACEDILRDMHDCNGSLETLLKDRVQLSLMEARETLGKLT